jgi:D-tyrosyl-tRNA(Tyr) deacylase
MKILIQRVSQASVEVAGKIVGAIESGLLIFIGVTHTDTIDQTAWLANKLVNLRLFEDDQGKMNKSLIDAKGEVLVVSQFTLYADCNAGRRPSFTQAASPELGEQLYEQFIEALRTEGVSVQTGIFGAKMKVSLLNDGPVTIMLER